ncbi:Replication factor C subunit 5 [Bifiguratus adelaidae]|uniref:Replication factor C subunit 5 n=1 Tax=Bifiguratus adelaidae TaxID=1938954 RepID=A0A261Y376_9FUNG|nr:Replication factor C subunit 5 [Bifiguratus adelaidae]
MSLWVDKYRPTTLEKLSYHDDLSAHLKQLASLPDFPHLLFYGPSGAGKKTRIVAVLRELYGAGVEKLKIDQRIFVTPSNRKLELNVVSSNYHLELNPSDVGMYDRMVVQELIKDVAQTQQVDANAKHRFKVIVINEADALTRDAQSALRRTMEKYMSNLRLILCCNTTSKIIAPIRSRCLLVRVAAPSIEDISAVLRTVAKKESFKLSTQVAENIAEQADRNLRKALLMLEAAKVQGNLNEGDAVPGTDWEIFISQIAASIVEQQTPHRLLEVRGKVYELLSHCIPADMVLKTLAFELLKLVRPEMRPEIVHWAAFYEHRLKNGSKQIFHIEAFVAKVMSVYKKMLMSQ